MSGKQLDHDPKPCYAATDIGVLVAEPIYPNTQYKYSSYTFPILNSKTLVSLYKVIYLWLKLKSPEDMYWGSEDLCRFCLCSLISCVSV